MVAAWDFLDRRQG